MRPMQTKFSVLPLIAAIALSLSACNGGEEASSPDEANQSGAEEAPGNPGATSPGTAGPEAGDTAAADETGAADKRDPLAAIATAVEAVPGSSAVELDYSKRNQSWEVELINVSAVHEVAVSPDGSKVLDHHPAGSADPEDSGDLKQANISMTEAVGTVLEEADGPVDEVSLDDEDGRPMWEIEIESPDGTSTELLVDGMTGELIR